jgi:hypothetical protein
MLTGLRSNARGVWVERLRYFAEPGTAPIDLLACADGAPIALLWDLPACGPCARIVATVRRLPFPGGPWPRIVLRAHRRRPLTVRPRRPFTVSPDDYPADARWQSRRKPFGLVMVGHCVWKEREA